MNISEFEKPASEKLAKVNEALDTLYGVPSVRHY